MVRGRWRVAEVWYNSSTSFLAYFLGGSSMRWVKSARPLSCFVSSSLTVIGFRNSNCDVDWFAVLTVWFICAFAMFQNNYVDRYLDVGKGRLLASRYPKKFRNVTLVIAVTCLVLCLILFLRNTEYGCLALGMLILSFVYSDVQRNPWLKNFIVSVTVASTVLFPVIKGSGTGKQWLLFVAVACFISCREHVKDIEDIAVDEGHKITLALRYPKLGSAQLSSLQAMRLKLYMDGSFSVLLFVGFAWKG
jgi:4-hydroxybenzoate polyprenyltransferase